MNSNTINLLITLKNASLIKKEIVFIKNSHITLEIITLLYKEGIIQSFTNMGSQIKISLRYSFNKNIFKNLKTFSNSIDLKYSDICKISSKQNLIVISTSKGFLSCLDCKKYHLGGKLFFIC